MRLSTRLLLLVLLCLLPVIGVETLTQLELRARRAADFGDLALHQAELWNGNLESIVEGARQLTVAISQYPAVQALNSGCASRLQATQASLSAYRFLAVFAADGHSSAAPFPGWKRRWKRVGSGSRRPGERAAFGAGRYEDGTGLGGPLPALFPADERRRRAARGRGGGVDLSWLAAEFTEMRTRSAQALSNSTLVLTDRDGTILYRFPEPDRWRGQSIAHDAAALIHAGQPGVANVTSHDGKRRIVGYVPAETEPLDVFVASGLYASDTTADLDAASRRRGAHDRLLGSDRAADRLVGRARLHRTADETAAGGREALAGRGPHVARGFRRGQVGIRPARPRLQRDGGGAPGARRGARPASPAARGAGGRTHPGAVRDEQPPPGGDRRTRADRGGPASGAEAASRRPARRRDRARLQQPAGDGARQPRTDRAAASCPTTARCSPWSSEPSARCSAAPS